jgi:hypothetical protein
LVVAALHRCAPSEGAAALQATEWLLVRRPEDGLLAGQWEFPNTLIASDKDQIPEDPGASVRSTAFEEILCGGGERAVRQYSICVDDCLA